MPASVTLRKSLPSGRTIAIELPRVWNAIQDPRFTHSSASAATVLSTGVILKYGISTAEADFHFRFCMSALA